MKRSGTVQAQKHAEGSAGCEHCGRQKHDPVTIPSESGNRVFCSADCVALEDRGQGDLLEALSRERNRMLESIERSRRSHVITLIHRYETTDAGAQYITIDNAGEILEEIQNTAPGTRIDFIAHCPGGMVLPAEQIALALKAHRGGVTAIVPYYAMSGATLICLAADELVMEPYTALGPLDPQIGDFPSPSLLALVKSKPAQFISDETLILADIAAKALLQMRTFVASLLSERLGQKAAERVAGYLTGGYLTHDAAITYKELRAVGLEVQLGVPGEIHRFMSMNRLVHATASAVSRPGGPGRDADPVGHPGPSNHN